MLRKLVRAVFTIVGAVLGYGAFLLVKFLARFFGHDDWVNFTNMQEFYISVSFALIFGLIFFQLTPTIKKQGNKMADNIESDLKKVSTNDIVMGTAGLIAGLIIAFLISQIYAGIKIPYLSVILNIITYILLGYLGITIATKKSSDIKAFWLTSRRISSVGGKNSKQKMDATPKIFDTSVIIDGRISDIMKTGFIEGPIVIPEFVLVELRHIADSSDALKRNRGRRGLDILNKIQSDYGIEIYNTTAEKALDEIPEVDAVLGTTAYDKILDAIDEALKGHHTLTLADTDLLPEVETKRLVTTGGHFAYLKIAEGCDKHCTYCIIPKIRGNFRSVPMEQLLSEAEYLAEQGVKELILVAQETTLYGKDLYGEKSLHKLLRELCKFSGIRWIRILYCYPEEIYDELIQTIKEEPKICHYLDLPIQHANDEILKRMGRRTTKQELIDIISKLRREIPDIALRTTLITGFPGETKEQHEELMEFVDEMEFDRLGVFTYSPEEDTAAARMEGQIEEEVKEERQAELMELQQEIAFDTAENMVGKEVLVMIEGKVADENAYVGRTYRDAPNVDGLIFVNTEEELMSGDFAEAVVTGSDEYDLIGELYEEHESAE